MTRLYKKGDYKFLYSKIKFMKSERILIYQQAYLQTVAAF